MNPADLFNRELKDGAHFRRLRDSFMSSRELFLSRLSQGQEYMSPMSSSPPSYPPPNKSSRNIQWSLGTNYQPTRETRFPIQRIKKLRLGHINFSHYLPRNHYVQSYDYR